LRLILTKSQHSELRLYASLLSFLRGFTVWSNWTTWKRLPP
jgi:hypothetical protein